MEERIEIGFNPTLVRLRPIHHGPLRVVFVPFQSHAGSIEADLGYPFGVVEAPSFNPTLVRLRLKE